MGPRGDVAGALAAVLDGAPYGSGSAEVEEAKVCLCLCLVFLLKPYLPHKLFTDLTVTVTVTVPCLRPRPRSPTKQTVNLQTLLSILGSTKSTDIPAIVRALPADAQDTLMKYLYKGMGVSGWGDVSGSVLLGWHEKVRFNFYFYCDCNWVVSCVAPLYLLQFRLTDVYYEIFLCAVDGGCGYGVYRAGDDG